MLSLARLRRYYNPARLNQFLDRYSPIILSCLIAIVFYHSYTLIQQSDGGSDLVSADIPKSLMLLHGQNPYSVDPWASPYPPLLLFTVSAIIRLTSFYSAQSSLDFLSQQIRIAGLLADAIVAVTIFLFIRHKTHNSLQAIIPAAIFLALPALSTSPLYFFHSDTFGYPILAISLVALAGGRYLLGTSLLATATIFKIHPILALTLILVWLARTRGIRATIPSLASSTIITLLGLGLPLATPGYQRAVLGFNLANTGNGTTLYDTFNLINNILPKQLQIIPTDLLANQIWLAATLALFTIALGIVWTRAKSLEPIDIVLLGLLAWLIPLRIEYTHYVEWAIVPFLMRGHTRQTFIVLGLLQLADTISYWTWWPSSSLLPNITAFTGPILDSAVYRILGLTALGFVLYSLRNRQLSLQAVRPTPTLNPSN